MTLWHASLDLHQTAVGYLAATAMESLRLASEAGKGEIGLDTSG